MISNSQPKPDRKWSEGAKKLWKRSLTDYSIADEHHLALLHAACCQLTRADGCRQVIDRDGLTVKDRFNQVRPHPLLAQEDKALNTFRLLVRELGFDMAELPEVRGPRAKGYAQ